MNHILFPSWQLGPILSGWSRLTTHEMCCEAFTYCCIWFTAGIYVMWICDTFFFFLSCSPHMPCGEYVIHCAAVHPVYDILKVFCPTLSISSRSTWHIYSIRFVLNSWDFARTTWTAKLLDQLKCQISNSIGTFLNSHYTVKLVDSLKQWSFLSWHRCRLDFIIERKTPRTPKLWHILDSSLLYFVPCI
jgi:hypothetical protein